MRKRWKNKRISGCCWCPRFVSVYQHKKMIKKTDHYTVINCDGEVDILKLEPPYCGWSYRHITRDEKRIIPDWCEGLEE